MKRYRNLSVALGVALALLACPAWGQGRVRPPHGELEQITESKPLTNDVLHLDNGDKISGTVLRLDDGMLVATGDLVEGKLRVPLKNVKLALFRTPKELPELPGDRLVFPNGDRLSVTLSGLEDDVLKATTSAGDTLDIKTERLTGVIFLRKPHTVYENDFESDELKGLTPVSGKWAIENGRLVQKERNASFSNATLKVTQDGRFQYEWTANLLSGYTYGFYFFAENNQSVHGGTSYLVLAQGRSIYLYKVLNDNQQYYANYTIPKRNKRTQFRLDYNPDNGHIILAVDGKDAFRYRDPQPIQSGRYVVLRVDSVGSFDDLAVRRLGGGRILATEAKARGRDIVCLANNDEVSGTVLSMDDETVLMKTDYDEDPVDIRRSYVSSVTFYRQASTAAGDASARITLVNDDVVTGRLIGLDAETLIVETDVLGRVTLSRALVRELRAADAGEDEIIRLRGNPPKGEPIFRRPGPGFGRLEIDGFGPRGFVVVDDGDEDVIIEEEGDDEVF